MISAVIDIISISSTRISHTAPAPCISLSTSPPVSPSPLNFPTPVTSSSSVESPLSSILIHNSLTFTPGLKPTFSQILPTTDFRPPSGLTQRTITRTQDRIFLTTLVFFCFSSFFSFLFSIPCGRLSWLSVSFSAPANHFISYHTQRFRSVKTGCKSMQATVVRKVDNNDVELDQRITR